MLNTCSLMGRLTKDPELRYTQSKTPVANFTLAVERDFSGGENGEKKTDFIDCMAWRSTAEFISKYFHKGSMAIVNGSLRIDNWTDNEGNKRRNAKVVVNSVYFGEKKEASSGTPRENTEFNSGNNYDESVGFSEISEYEDELPF